MTTPPIPQGTTARGYGHAHQTERKRWEPAVNAGHAICTRCQLPIEQGEAWDLGHSDDRTTYTGPEHMACNRSAGALKAQTRRTMITRDW